MRGEVLVVAGQRHVDKVLLVAEPPEGGGEGVVVVGPPEAVVLPSSIAIAVVRRSDGRVVVRIRPHRRCRLRSL